MSKPTDEDLNRGTDKFVPDEPKSMEKVLTVQGIIAKTPKELAEVLKNAGYIHRSQIQPVVDVYNELLYQKPHITTNDLKKDVNKMWRVIKQVAERVK